MHDDFDEISAIFSAERLSSLEQSLKEALRPAEPRYNREAALSFMTTAYSELAGPSFSTFAARLSEENPDELSSQMANMHQLHAWACGMLPAAEGHLRALKREKLLIPARGVYTDTDRTVHLEAECNALITLVSLLEYVKDRAERTIMACQTLLNRLAGEVITTRTDRYTG
jgi:hypothetical protein